MRWMLVWVLSFALFSANGQNRFDVFYVGGQYNAIKNVPEDLSDNYEYALTSNLSIPLVFKDSSIWFTSVDYQYFDVNTPYNGLADIEKYQLQGVILRTGYIYPLAKNHSLQAFVSPRIMGDLNSSFSSKLQMGGMVLYETKKSENFRYSVGLLYNREFFGDYFVPLFQIDWKISPKLRLKGFMPIYAKLAMQMNEKLSAGFHFFGLTTSYRISDPVLPKSYIDRRSIDLSVFGNLQLGTNLFLEGRLGYALVRDYALYQNSEQVDFAIPLAEFGPERTRSNIEMGSSPFVHFRLIYSVAID